MCTFTESHPSLTTFLTSVCAIVGELSNESAAVCVCVCLQPVAGGVFTVAGIVDKMVYRGTEVIRKKMELGKLG